MKFLASLRLTPVYALVLTVITSLLLRTIPSSYLAELLTQRGPLTYVIVFMFFSILGLVTIARYQGLYTPAFIFGLFGLSLTPTFLGLIGTISGFSMSLLGLNSESGIALIRDTDLKTAMQTIDSFYTGVAHSTDTTLLGLMATLITWSVVAFFCLQDYKKDCKA